MKKENYLSYNEIMLAQRRPLIHKGDRKDVLQVVRPICIMYIYGADLSQLPERSGIHMSEIALHPGEETEAVFTTSVFSVFTYTALRAPVRSSQEQVKFSSSKSKQGRIPITTSRDLSSRAYLKHTVYAFNRSSAPHLSMGCIWYCT